MSTVEPREIETTGPTFSPATRVTRGQYRWSWGRDLRSLPPAWKCLLWPGIALIVASVMAPIYLLLLRPPADKVIDFYQEWASARNYWEGLPVYTDHSVTIPRYLALDPSKPKYRLIEMNAHPPTSVLMALPLAFLPYRDAVLVWNITSLGMFALSIAMVWRGFRLSFSAKSLSLLIISLLVCGPLLVQVSFAQLNLVILLLLSGTWAADRTQRPAMAGTLLGMATAIKLFPGFLFLYFVMRRQWKTLIVGLMSLASFTVLTAALFGPGVYRDYCRDSLPRVAKFRGGGPNASLVGFWVKLFDPPPGGTTRIEPLWYSPMIALLGIVISYTLVLTILASVVRLARSRIEQDLAFSLSLTAMLLISPITWDHYLLFLLVPIVATWICLPRTVGARVFFASILIAFWTIPALVEAIFTGGKALEVVGPLHTLTFYSYQFYALSAFFALISFEFMRFHDLPMSDPIPPPKSTEPALAFADST